LFRAVTRANPGSRTTNPFETPVVYFTNDEVRKFREFEARSLSLFDESQRLFKSAPSHTGKGSSKLTLIRYGQTKPQALASIGTRRRIEPDIYIYIYTLRPSRSRTSDNESQKSRMRAYTIVNQQRPRVGIPTPLQPTRLQRSTHHDTSLDFIHSGD
jgi:hypothetical protein